MTGLRSRRSRGFTLIEVMMVSAIVGVLATVAIPEYNRMLVRAKTPERAVIMGRIRRGVEDAFLRNQLPAAGNLTGAPTPAAVPGIMKVVPNWRQAGWSVVFASMSDVEGSVYYQYAFTAQEPQGLLTISATGDLDGDGNAAFKSCTYQRVDGAYQIDPVGLPGTGCTCPPAGVALDCEPEAFGLF